MCKRCTLVLTCSRRKLNIDEVTLLKKFDEESIVITLNLFRDDFSILNNELMRCLFMPYFIFTNFLLAIFPT